MNHKLRVLVRVDVDPGQVTLEVTGCLTQPDFPALMHFIRSAGRFAPGTGVSVDLYGASHLDPEILLQLRELADSSPGQGGTGDLRVALLEPADLPFCLQHVGADGQCLAGIGDGMELSECFEGNLDPAATVRALSDGALGQLADALYRHLDTSSPSYGAHTWYELAAEELQNRHVGGAAGPAEDEVRPDTALT